MEFVLAASVLAILWLIRTVRALDSYCALVEYRSLVVSMALLKQGALDGNDFVEVHNWFRQELPQEYAVLQHKLSKGGIDVEKDLLFSLADDTVKKDASAR